MKVISMQRTRQARREAEIEGISDLALMLDAVIDEAIGRDKGIIDSYEKYNQMVEVLNFLIDTYIEERYD